MLSATEDRQASDEGSVSAVVVNYNAGAYLIQCITTTLAQVDEVLVVDNASADGSLDLLSQYFSAEPRLKLIRNAKNLGFAAACNIGANQANGESILFLNPDCTLDDNAVSTLMQALHSDPSVGMVGGLLINRDGTEQGGSRRAVPTPWRSFVRAFGLHRFNNRWPRLFFDFHLHNQPLSFPRNFVCQG
jgi:GT2 family glycosyltransferase